MGKQQDRYSPTACKAAMIGCERFSLQNCEPRPGSPA
jgi:hypothetical protein